MQINNHQIVDYDAVLDAKFGAEGTPERAEAPIGSFKASKTSFADNWKSEINLTALREGENVEHHLRSLQAPEEISGFSSVPPIYTNQTKVAAYYFDLLMRTKEMLEKSISAMPEADRSHYELLIYRINKAVEIK